MSLLLLMNQRFSLHSRFSNAPFGVCGSLTGNISRNCTSAGWSDVFPNISSVCGSNTSPDKVSERRHRCRAHAQPKRRRTFQGPPVGPRASKEIVARVFVSPGNIWGIFQLLVSTAALRCLMVTEDEILRKTSHSCCKSGLFY